MAHGSVRRVTVNLVNLLELANQQGLDTVTREVCVKADLYKGDAPKRGVKL